MRQGVRVRFGLGMMGRERVDVDRIDRGKGRGSSADGLGVGLDLRLGLRIGIDVRLGRRLGVGPGLCLGLQLDQVR